MYLSIIIPAYNEEKRIGATLSKIYEFLKDKKYDFEVIAVDDGSVDNTVSIISESRLAKENKLKILRNGDNKGKGYSVKRGIINSGGDYVLFSDADLSTPIEELDKFLNSMPEGCDMVIGSRSIKDSDIKVRQPWYRESMGKIFNFFVKLLLIREFNDTQCGFKLIKGDAARELAGLMKINGFAFDVEMLYLAHKKGYKIKEKGVSWNNSAETKVRLLHSSTSMFLDLLRIKAIH